MVNESVVKSSRKSNTQDATNTKTPQLIIQHTYNQKYTQPLTHTRAVPKHRGQVFISKNPTYFRNDILTDAISNIYTFAK